MKKTEPRIPPAALPRRHGRRHCYRGGLRLEDRIADESADQTEKRIDDEVEYERNADEPPIAHQSLYHLHCFRWDLIPVGPLKRLAELYTRGSVKYTAWNWAKGIKMSRCYASAFRHLMQWVMGDKDEDHLAAVVFNVFCIMHYEDTGRTDLDDMGIYREAA